MIKCKPSEFILHWILKSLLSLLYFQIYLDSLVSFSFNCLKQTQSLNLFRSLTWQPLLHYHHQQFNSVSVQMDQSCRLSLSLAVVVPIQVLLCPAGTKHCWEELMGTFCPMWGYACDVISSPYLKLLTVQTSIHTEKSWLCNVIALDYVKLYHSICRSLYSCAYNYSGLAK